jgi:intracellular septation protein
VKRENAQWVRSVVDFGALAAFVTAYAITRDVVQATWALVAASAVALILGYVVERRVAPMPLIAGGFALVFGLLTIILHDKDIIKIKVTVMNGAFAVILIGGLLAKKNFLQMLLGSAIEMDAKAWRTLAIRYALFFAACAATNEYVWRTQSDDFWVLKFRPFLWVAALVFAISQAPFIMKHMQQPKVPETPDPGM